MAVSTDTHSMALFCDFENVALGVRDAKYDKFDIGKVLDQILVAPDDQILMITSANQVIRLKASDIRRTGRDAKGVRLQRLGEGDEVIAITNLGLQAKQLTDITGEPQQSPLTL